MAEPRELFRLLDAAGRQFTFPEEKLPHEASRRLLEFLGVKIVKTNEEIDAGILARFGERELTVRCQPCAWSFTGPTTTAISEQRTHSESAEHARGLLQAVDRGEHLPKPRGETMGEKTCEACGFEKAPTHGRYAGIGVACRRKGFYRKDGQIHPPAGTPPPEPAEPEPGLGLTLPPLPPAPPEPESEPEAPIDVPVERKVSVEEVTQRIVETANAVFEQRRVVAAEEQRLEEAIAEYRAATSEVVPESPVA